MWAVSVYTLGVLYNILSFTFQTISHLKVFELLDKLTVSKATGIDKLSTKVFKVTAPGITNSITKIFDCSIESGEFLLNWKTTRVTYYFTRKRFQKFARQLCPISILSTTSKIFDKINFVYKHQFSLCHVNIVRLHKRMVHKYGSWSL